MMQKPRTNSDWSANTPILPAQGPRRLALTADFRIGVTGMEMFMPAARLQSPLIDAVPGLVNERRMRQWIEQNRDALIQEQTAQQTAAIKELQSRRY